MITGGSDYNILSVNVLDKMADDTGCQLHGDCLTCPMAVCIYDTKMGIVKVRRQQRYGEIRELAKIMPAHAIASKFGVSLRTVQRALKGHKEAHHDKE